ncbi:hypothetical protein [Arthrobacter bambusae]|uniref:RraA family protein n=2 Tax=Arthrobacter TaxID=1663 RepID=UPI00254EADFA|nr:MULTISPECIES: hypothetical protein [Arthrobacter]
MGLAVFARAVVPAGPSKNGPGYVGKPVACGNVVCNPRDVVIGDADGSSSFLSPSSPKPSRHSRPRKTSNARSATGSKKPSPPRSHQSPTTLTRATAAPSGRCRSCRPVTEST